MAQREALVVVQSTRAEILNGTPIQVVVDRVVTTLRSRAGIRGVLCRTTDARTNVALVSVVAERPSILKRLAGNGVTAVYHEVTERTVRNFVRTFGDTIADSAWSWAHGQHAARSPNASA